MTHLISLDAPNETGKTCIPEEHVAAFNWSGDTAHRKLFNPTSSSLQQTTENILLWRHIFTKGRKTSQKRKMGCMSLWGRWKWRVIMFDIELWRIHWHWFGLASHYGIVCLRCLSAKQSRNPRNDTGTGLFALDVIDLCLLSRFLLNATDGWHSFQIRA